MYTLTRGEPVLKILVDNTRISGSFVMNCRELHKKRVIIGDVTNIITCVELEGWYASTFKTLNWYIELRLHLACFISLITLQFAVVQNHFPAHFESCLPFAVLNAILRVVYPLQSYMLSRKI